jgi:hypothetical protein
VTQEVEVEIGRLFRCRLVHGDVYL